MKYKWNLVFFCLLICLFTISSVVASDVNETNDLCKLDNDEFISVENSEIDEMESLDDFDINESNDIEKNDLMEDSNLTIEKDNVLKASQPSISTSNIRSNSLTVYLKDSSGNQVSNVKMSYSFDSSENSYTVYSGGSVNIPSFLTYDEYHAVTFVCFYENTILRKSTFFYIDSYGKSSIVDKGFSRTYFVVPNNENVFDYLTIYLRDANNAVNIYENFTYSFDGSSVKYTSSGGNISLNFNKNTEHTITLQYKGNKKNYTPTTYTFKFNYFNSVEFANEDKYSIVDGGMSIPYYVYDTEGKIKKSSNIFAPFGLNNLSVYNQYTKHTVTKEVNIKKRILETNDLIMDYEDFIEFKVRAANENDMFVKNLQVTFILNGDSINQYTDSDGYATFKKHLKAGNYTITTKYNGVVNQNKISINPVYSNNKYKNLFLQSATLYYGENKIINYGWQGNFKGHLKIYKGNSLIKDFNLDTSGIIDDYFSYDDYSNSFSTSLLNNIGIYRLKIIDVNGNVVEESTVNIKKIPIKISANDFNGFKNTKFTIKLSLTEKNTNKKVNGKVTVKLNGKTFNVNIKNGKGNLKIRSPSKFKTYYGKVYYNGKDIYESSSYVFKVKVTKFNSKIYFSVSNGKSSKEVKLKAKILYKNGSKKVKKGIVKFKFRGKTYKSKIKKGVAQVIGITPKTGDYSCKISYPGNKNIKGSSIKEKFYSYIYEKKTPKKKTKKHSKSKTLTLNAKYKWVTKKKGKYTVKARLWRVFSGIMGYYNDVDIILYKNGIQQKSSKYLSNYKYKENGKWKWQKWRHGGVDHAYHRYTTFSQVSKIKVKW